MRSLILITLVCCSFISARAQLTRGAMLWQGGIQLESQTGNGALVFTLSPEVHYFLSDRFTVGGRFTLGSTFEDGVQLLVVEPELRYYFNSQTPASNFFTFLQPEFFFPIDEELGAENQFRLFWGGGWQARLTPNVALESKLSVVYNNNNPRQVSDGFFRNPAFQLETGLMVLLNAYEENPARPAIARGVWMIGGSNLRVSYQSKDFFRLFNFSVSPRAGYFFSDHFAAGLGLPFSFSQSLNENFGNFFFDRITTQVIGLAPFFRYYPGRLGYQIHPFLDLQGSYLLTRHHDLSSAFPTDIPRHRYQFQISGGINYFLSPTAALETAAFLNWDANTDNTRLGIQLGFQFFLAPQPVDLGY